MDFLILYLLELLFDLRMKLKDLDLIRYTSELNVIRILNFAFDL